MVSSSWDPQHLGSVDGDVVRMQLVVCITCRNIRILTSDSLLFFVHFSMRATGTTSLSLTEAPNKRGGVVRGGGALRVLPGAHVTLARLSRQASSLVESGASASGVVAAANALLLFQRC